MLRSLLWNLFVFFDISNKGELKEAFLLKKYSITFKKKITNEKELNLIS